MNKIARTNKNISEVNLIRKLFLDTNTKSFSFISNSKKRELRTFLEKSYKVDELAYLFLCPTFFIWLSCVVNCTEPNFQTCYFSRTKDCKKGFQFIVWYKKMLEVNFGLKYRVLFIVFDSFSYSEVVTVIIKRWLSFP